MSRKASRRLRAHHYASKADIAEIHRIFGERKDWLERLERTCETQFARIAQIQAELDGIRQAWAKSRVGKKR
jgi:hypothetical protein